MTTRVNGETMLTACGASYQAVQQWKRKGQFIMPSGYRFVTSLGGNSYWGFIAESKEAIVVAFRGTGSLFDLFRDFNWGLVPFPFAAQCGMVHRGFTELYEHKVRPQLFDALGKLSSRKRLLLAGHSLGGALATIAALDVALHTRFRKLWVCTFGSPKVGDSTFAAAYERAVPVSVRVANVHDFLTLFPPFGGGPFPYVHVHKEASVAFRYSNMLLNHQTRSYAWALARLYPRTYKRFRKLSPGFLPSSGPGEAAM